VALAPGRPLALDLPAGRFHALRFGASGGRLALCVPGLSSNCTAFAAIGEGLAAGGRQVVALDLRGRGRTPATSRGTYGWPRHARDVLEAAARLSGEPVDLVGHSMGAFVAMQAASMAPAAVRSLVLVDGAGPPEPAAMPAIRAAVGRLDTVHPSAAELIAVIRRLGIIEPWSERWERYFEHELEPVPGGVRARTDRAAVLEDLAWGEEHDPSDLWDDLRAPALLVRAALPLGPDGGHIVGADDRDRFLATVPGSRAVEVPANHYGVVMHEATIRAIGEFLAGVP
jgi:pimeloyl-ACP methyl ester carboxylesterase